MDQDFSMWGGGSLSSGGHLAMSRDIFSCLNWARVRGVGLQYPTMNRAVAYNKVPNSQCQQSIDSENPAVGTYLFLLKYH